MFRTYKSLEIPKGLWVIYACHVLLLTFTCSPTCKDILFFIKHFTSDHYSRTLIISVTEYMSFLISFDFLTILRYFAWFGLPTSFISWATSGKPFGLFPGVPCIRLSWSFVNLSASWLADMLQCEGIHCMKTAHSNVHHVIHDTPYWHGTVCLVSFSQSGIVLPESI